MSNEQGVEALSSWATTFFNIMKDKKQTYSYLLKDPRWKEKAREIKEWDREVCQLCGDSSDLQVHHLCYDNEREPWDYPRTALVTLCKNCHKKIHDCEKNFNANLTDLITKLGLNGVSKNTVLNILHIILKDAVRYKEDNIFDNLLYSCPYSESFWVFGREYKNNIFEKERIRDREFLNLARKAYEWNTGRKDFSEEKAFEGEYHDDIIEYKQEFGIE